MGKGGEKEGGMRGKAVEEVRMRKEGLEQG